jgi:hypothetical protein
MSPRSEPEKKYVYMFIQPNETNILEGFTTELTVMGVPEDDPNRPEPVTRYVDFKVNPKGPEPLTDSRSQVKIVGATKDGSAIIVKAIKPNAEPAELVATPRKGSPLPSGLVARARLWVDESDLLLYAPDGRIYWLPTKMWMRAKSFDPKELKDLKQLSKAILPLLKNETVVANIPHEAHGQPDGRSQRSDGASAGPTEPAEPVTCFLLNLNSILLSYAPSKGLDTAQQDASPFPAVQEGAYSHKKS